MKWEHRERYLNGKGLDLSITLCLDICQFAKCCSELIFQGERFCFQLSSRIFKLLRQVLTASQVTMNQLMCITQQFLIFLQHREKKTSHKHHHRAEVDNVRKQSMYASFKYRRPTFDKKF